MADPDSPTAPTEDAHVKKFRKELNAGTVSLVLLSILAKSDEAMYGYQIAKEMEQSENGQPLVKQGALYPVLRSMSALGLLASRVEPSSSGPPRRYETRKKRDFHQPVIISVVQAGGCHASMFVHCHY